MSNLAAPVLHDGATGEWCGDATSVVEFLRPLRALARRAGCPRGLRQPTGRDDGRDHRRLGDVPGLQADRRALPVAGDRGRDLLGPADQPGAAAPRGDTAHWRTDSVRHSAGGDARNRIDHHPQARRSHPPSRRLRARRPVRSHGHRQPHGSEQAPALRARARRPEGSAALRRLPAAGGAASTSPSSSAARPVPARRPS